jgi:aminoglycoside phosphotransferase (APT) family kinase protein
LVIGHNDAPPFKAVWDEAGLVGFMDWDMSGPLALESDVVWMAFWCVPLHAREVVEAEGFTDFGNRRRRLELSLREYCLGGSGWNLTADGLLHVLRLGRPVKIDAVRATAHSGDATYQGLLDHGSDLLLVCALEGLDEV